MSRQTLVSGCVVLGAVLLASASPAPPALAAVPTNVKGSYTGTWVNDAGTRDGKLTFKIKSQKRATGLFIIKGEGKFGTYRKQTLQGTYVPTSRTLSFTLYHASKSAKFHGIGLVLGSDDKTWSGNYSISNAHSQNLEHGTVVAKKK